MLFKLFSLFLKLGALSFGGGYALMALILGEGNKLVGLTPAEFADLAALELLASGPIAINAATYVGYIKSGLLGSVVSTVAVCAPSICFAITISYFITKFKDSMILKNFMNSIKIAVGALMLSTALSIGEDVLLTNKEMFSVLSPGLWLSSVNIIAVIICVAVFVAVVKLKVNPILCILGSAVLGAIFL